MSRQALRPESDTPALASAQRPIRGSKSDISQRLRETIGDEHQTAFARRAGVGETTIRKYLAGAEPSTSRLVALADAAGVSVEWLAAGRGPRERASLAAQARLDDVERLRTVLAAVEEGLRASRRTLPPDKFADLVVAAYELIDTSDAQGRAKVLRLVKAAA